MLEFLNEVCIFALYLEIGTCAFMVVGDRAALLLPFGCGMVSTVENNHFVRLHHRACAVVGTKLR